MNSCPVPGGYSEYCRIIEQELDRTGIELHLIPEVAARVVNIVQDPEVSAHDLNKIIMSDQVIATRVLRVANSPLFPAGEPRRPGQISGPDGQNR